MMLLFSRTIFKQLTKTAKLFYAMYLPYVALHQLIKAMVYGVMYCLVAAQKIIRSDGP
jgi:hypothetical protein